MEVAFERATWRTLKGVFSLWASTNSRRNFASQALPSPLLRTNYLRPQRRKFPSTLREGEYAVLPAHEVPEIIRRPAYATAVDGRPLPPGTTGDLARDCLVDSDPPGWSIDPAGEVQSPEALQRMRKVCRLAATALKIAIDASKPGVTTEAIDAAVHRFLVSQGAYPAAINFFGFPKSVCASVNEVACHGVPSLRPLREGDVVSYDCTAYLNGFFGDCAGTTVIRPASQEHEKLVAAAKECLNVAIRAVKPGVPIARIGEVITSNNERFVAVHWASHQRCGVCAQQMTRNTCSAWDKHLQLSQFSAKAVAMFVAGKTGGQLSHRIAADVLNLYEQQHGSVCSLTAAGYRVASLVQEHTLVVTEDGAEPLTCAED